jgi:hypothetical protein
VGRRRERMERRGKAWGLWRRRKMESRTWGRETGKVGVGARDELGVANTLGSSWRGSSGRFWACSAPQNGVEAVESGAKTREIVVREQRRKVEYGLGRWLQRRERRREVENGLERWGRWAFGEKGDLRDVESEMGGNQDQRALIGHGGSGKMKDGRDWRDWRAGNGLSVHWH